MRTSQLMQHTMDQPSMFEQNSMINHTINVKEEQAHMKI